MHLFVVVFFLPARLCAFLPLLLARRAITVPPPAFLLHLKADAAHLEGIQRKSQPRLAAIAAKRSYVDCASTPDETTPPLPTHTRPSHAPIAYAYSTKSRPDGLLLLTCTYGLRLLDIDTLTDADCRLANW